jgi:avirulence protein
VGRWLHTAADEATTLADKIEAIKARIDALQAKALDATAADDIIAKIAEIHWLLAQAMPWERGAASIAEVYTDALKLSKGIKLIKVFDKFKPDIAAFLMTLTEFISAHREAYKKEEK